VAVTVVVVIAVFVAVAAVLVVVVFVIKPILLAEGYYGSCLLDTAIASF
jgi:hypothetical protein